MRKRVSSKLKSQVAITAIKGEMTLAEIASKYEVHTATITKWKAEAEKHLIEIFEKKGRKDMEKKDHLITELYKLVGQREMELDWLKKKVNMFS